MPEFDNGLSEAERGFKANENTDSKPESSVEGKEKSWTSIEEGRISFPLNETECLRNPSVTAEVINNSDYEGSIKLKNLKEFSFTLVDDLRGSGPESDAVQYLSENIDKLKDYVGAGEIKTWEGEHQEDSTASYASYSFKDGNEEQQQKLIELLGWENFKNNPQEDVINYKMSVVDLAHKLGMS